MTPFREVYDIGGHDVCGHNQEERWWRLAREDGSSAYIQYTQSQNGEDTAAGSQYPAYGTWGRGMDMIISIL